MLKFVYYLTTPILLFNRSITSRLIKRNLSDATREELDAMLENSHDEGSLDSDEYRILKNMMKFGSVLVSDVMTPRTVICSLDADSIIGEVIDLQEIKMYSRLPVWSGKSLDDETIGYVLSKDILLDAIKGNHNKKISELSRQVYFIPENAPLDSALDSFLQRRQHLFIVVDEYGGVEGLLTMEDVLETILGVEIVDEADKVIDLRLYAKQLRDKRVASLQGKVDIE
jgi:CBS domain containing-hemolysin-like protein